eukprot:TRINITY_DN5931_c0_g1_i1.p1 TRINITY_DN5931_c0_g1~~TRINITY_DN5931_c0_g1_i1.p1  ORF type:complete len:521 (+),score=76.06 TRINITY_DN5931_c0_g1_i1:147-1709(+)
MNAIQLIQGLFLLWVAVPIIRSVDPISELNAKFNSNPLWYQLEGSYEENHLTYIQSALSDRGFAFLPDFSPEREELWNLTWTVHWTPERFKALKEPWRRVNNFPGIKYPASKDNLHSILTKAKAKYGEEHFSFWPPGFSLHKEDQFQQFRAIFENYENNSQRQSGDEPPVYIVKLPALPRGQGVHLVSKLEQVDRLLSPEAGFLPLNKTRPIAQRYVKDVLTVEGHKMTLRIYVVITSMDPLRLYVYPNGLVRISSKRYSTDASTFSDQFVHIDSYDINHFNEQSFEASVANSSLQHEGLRCDVQYLLKRLEEQDGVNSSKLWDDIKYVSLMSFVGMENLMIRDFVDQALVNRPRRLNPFEMVGLDILIDKDYKVYLLEINNTPSMSPHTNLENVIKQNLIKDLFTLVDITNSDYHEVPRLVSKYWPHVKSFRANETVTSNSGGIFKVSSIESIEHLWTIVETELEETRRSQGNFETLFPLPKYKQYLPFFLNPRNQFIISWLEAGMKLADLERPQTKAT